MRKIISTILLMTMATSFSACTKTTEPSSTEPVKQQLTNHMTAKEKQEAKETDFQLLNHPWEQYMNTGTDNGFESYKDKVYLIPKIGAIVYGDPVFCIPPENYDGGKGTVSYMNYSDGSGEVPVTQIDFKNYEEFKTKLRAEVDKDIANGLHQVPANENYDHIISLFDAVIAGKAEITDQQNLDDYLEWFYAQTPGSDDDSYYWQMDDAEVAKIKDDIKEYHLYDEELDQRYVVHVTTPSGYDHTKEYPALVLTDAVWRFNDVTSLHKAMEEGKKDAQIIITVGFEYDIDSWDNEVRGNILCDHKKEFLDFIIDNMMPYLSEKYTFDYSRSTLFGHSQGGVFAHYAAFNYDLYENQPFARYIIGSPTFWTPYFTDVADYEKYKTEYGYFDRNSKYDRQLIITAGDKEDEDYQDYYGDNDSTNEGVKHLKERLEQHGVTTFEVKIYDSHHYQYVSAMLMEVV